MTDPTNDSGAMLAAKLAAALEYAQEAVEAGARARRAIVAFAADLNNVIRSLPAGQIAGLGVSVLVVMRGTPKVADVPGLQTEYLPSIDDGQFETRSGATSLYLRALGTGSDAVHVEVRSIPGQIVAATSTLDTMEQWLDDVRGIHLDAGGSASLVREDAAGKYHVNATHGNAAALFEAFLEALHIELKQRADFNHQP